jgi:hypothetical protein
MGCFDPLKTAYSNHIGRVVQNKIYHITKLVCLLALEKAYNQALTSAISKVIPEVQASIHSILKLYDLTFI